MKHWYNCWLVHKWGRWSEPTNAHERYTIIGGWNDVTTQTRVCTVCGRSTYREAK